MNITSRGGLRLSSGVGHRATAGFALNMGVEKQAFRPSAGVEVDQRHGGAYVQTQGSW